jgi:heterodisulfide reductase subunit A
MDGIYVCGSCRWPVDIRESVSQGYAAASKAAIPMRKGFVKVEAITASADKNICQGCGSCVAVCPFDAIEIQPFNGRKVAEVNAALCKGCGLCAATCPNGAMQQKGFSDLQLLSMINALVGRGGS